MIEWFLSGGVLMWPILVAAVAVLVQAVRAARERAPASDAVLFWGIFAGVVGLLGTVGGVAQMASVLERASEFSASLVWSGFRVTLVPTLFGLLVLNVALLLWAALHYVVEPKSLTGGAG